MSALSAAALVTAAALRLTVEGSCPTEAAIRTHLLTLLPSGAEKLPLFANVYRIDELLRVEVRAEDGALLAYKNFEPQTPCPALAFAAAVVIGAAVSDLAQRDLSLLTTAPPPPRKEKRRPPLPEFPPPPPLRIEGALAAGLSLSERPSFAALASFDLLPIHRQLGARLSVGGSLPRLQTLTPVTSEGSAPLAASWTRLFLALGPRYRLPLGRLRLDFSTGAAVAATLVEGVFVTAPPIALRSHGVDFGITSAVRLGYVDRRAATPRLAIGPYLEAQALAWLRPQELRLTGESPLGRLPGWEVLVAAGVALGTAP